MQKRLQQLRVAIEKDSHDETIAILRELLGPLNRMGWDDEAEDARLTFVAFESETDDYPVRETRKLWNREALKERDQVAAEFFLSWKEHLLSALDTLEQHLSE